MTDNRLLLFQPIERLEVQNHQMINTRFVQPERRALAHLLADADRHGCARGGVRGEADPGVQDMGPTVAKRHRLAVRACLGFGRADRGDYVVNRDGIGGNEPARLPDQNRVRGVGHELAVQQDANAFERWSEAQLAQGIQHVSEQVDRHRVSVRGAPIACRCTYDRQVSSCQLIDDHAN
jgi:hypothetical protein